MSNDFLVRNNNNNNNMPPGMRMLKSNSSSSSVVSPQHANTIRFDQQTIGHDFASNKILIADLAIRATAYPHYIPKQQQKQPTAPITPPKEQQQPRKRRVTFNLDQIQIQIIPAHDSESSSCCSSSLEEEEEEEEEVVVVQQMMLPASPPPLFKKQQQQQNDCIHESSKRYIPKKTSFEVFQKQEQIRNDHINMMINKPGYWYPIATSPNRPIPPQHKSLELTEQLINESIQRELKLNPSLKYAIPSPSPSPPHDKEAVVKQKKTTKAEEVGSILIIEEEEISTTTKDTIVTIPSSEDSHSEQQEEQQENSLMINSESTTTDFTSSVYHELAKRNIQKDIFIPPPTSIPSPTIVAATTMTSGVGTKEEEKQQTIIPSPPPSPIISDYSSSIVWIDHPSLLINKIIKQKGLFFVKVLKVESLDFPIDQTNIYCSIQYKGQKKTSQKQIMSHTMQIKHEMRIDNVDPNEQITISIHVDKTNTTWLNRRRLMNKSDLDRYVSEQDASICQTLFSPNRFIMEGRSGLDQSATLMLVNHWYKPSNQASSSSSSSSLRLSSVVVPRKKQLTATTVVAEKAVGKIYIQCLYIMVAAQQQLLPKTMDEAMEALNAKRFHQTIWQSGYLGQCGVPEKMMTPLTRRYFTLTGGTLIAHGDKGIPIYKIPLSRATQLIWGDDHYQSSITKEGSTTTTFLNQLNSVVRLHHHQQNNHQQTKFQLNFDSGEEIQFYCDSMDELNRWISVLKVMICKLPKLPDWIIV